MVNQTRRGDTHHKIGYGAPYEPTGGASKLKVGLIVAGLQHARIAMELAAVINGLRSRHGVSQGGPFAAAFLWIKRHIELQLFCQFDSNVEFGCQDGLPRRNKWGIPGLVET
jgi:hypothetical protein